MFTKYSGINVPKNYSGNRFKESIDTEMKTHKAEGVHISTPIKKSSSPQSFQSIIDKAVEPDTTNADYYEEIPGENEEISDPVSINEYDVEEAPLPEPITPAKELGLSTLLESLQEDDLLLIALILILAGNEGYENKELIITLALLLLYR